MSDVKYVGVDRMHMQNTIINERILKNIAIVSKKKKNIPLQLHIVNNSVQRKNHKKVPHPQSMFAHVQVPLAAAHIESFLFSTRIFAFYDEKKKIETF